MEPPPLPADPKPASPFAETDSASQSGASSASQGKVAPSPFVVEPSAERIEHWVGPYRYRGTRPLQPAEVARIVEAEAEAGRHGWLNVLYAALTVVGVLLVGSVLAIALGPSSIRVGVALSVLFALWGGGIFVARLRTAFGRVRALRLDLQLRVVDEFALTGEHEVFRQDPEGNEPREDSADPQGRPPEVLSRLPKSGVALEAEKLERSARLEVSRVARPMPPANLQTTPFPTRVDLAKDARDAVPTRSLSPAEREEIQRHVRKVEMSTALPFVSVFLLAFFGVRAVQTNSRFLIAFVVLELLIVVWGAHRFVKARKLTRALRRDLDGGVLAIRERTGENGIRYRVEELPASGVAWTIEGQPAFWRKTV